MLVKLSKRDLHDSKLMGADTVKLCEMQGFPPRLENEKQSRTDANILGFKAEFAVARLLNLDPPVVNVLTDGGVDLWFGDVSIDVKVTNRIDGPLVFDNMKKFQSDVAVLVGATDTEDVLKINGCMSRKEFEWKAYRKDFGYGEREVVDIPDLHPIEWLWRKFMEKRYSP